MSTSDNETKRMSLHEEASAQTDSVLVAFRCPRSLADAAEAAGAVEGLSRADIARRALIRDLGFKNTPVATPESAERHS
jgi:hypothetical protein